MAVGLHLIGFQHNVFALRRTDSHYGPAWAALIQLPILEILWRLKSILSDGRVVGRRGNTNTKIHAFYRQV